jgi:hypothetical protein
MTHPPTSPGAIAKSGPCRPLWLRPALAGQFLASPHFSANISCSPKALLWPARPLARDGSSCSPVTQRGWIKPSEAWGGILMCLQECYLGLPMLDATRGRARVSKYSLACTPEYGKHTGSFVKKDRATADMRNDKASRLLTEPDIIPRKWR